MLMNLHLYWTKLFYLKKNLSILRSVFYKIYIYEKKKNKQFNNGQI